MSCYSVPVGLARAEVSGALSLVDEVRVTPGGAVQQVAASTRCSAKLAQRLAAALVQPRVARTPGGVAVSFGAELVPLGWRAAGG